MNKNSIDRKRLEKELNVIYTALSSAANGVLITDKEGSVQYVNLAFLRMFGYQSETEVKGKYAAQLFASHEGRRFADIEAIIDQSRGETEQVHVLLLDDVMGKAGAAFDRLNGIMDKVDKGEGTLGRFAKDPQLYDHLVKLTAELKMFAQSVNSGEGTLGKLNKNSEPYDRLIAILERAEDTLKDIHSADGTLGRLVRDRQLYDKLVALADKSNQAADDVRQLNKKLTSTDGTIGKLLGDREFYDKGMALLERADNSLKSLETVTAMIERGDGTAGKLVSDKELYDRMNRTVESLDALVKDIKENPKRYVKFSLF